MASAQVYYSYAFSFHNWIDLEVISWGSDRSNRFRFSAVGCEKDYNKFLIIQCELLLPLLIFSSLLSD